MSQKRTCVVTGKEFIISEKQEKYCVANNIPLPDMCPEERMCQMEGMSNSVYLYNGTCDFTHKPILTPTPPDKGFTVYDIDVWNSDQWDPLDYGREIDWNRPFFEQFAELQKKVPVPSLFVAISTVVNSDFCNGVGYLKNCYLLFVSANDEDCLFSFGLFGCKNVVDTLWGTDCELCYGSFHITNCYNCRFVENCSNCSDSSFLYNCQGLKNCFGCVNLNNKEYCFYNEPYTKEEYQKKIAEVDLGSNERVKKEADKFHQFKLKFPHKHLIGKQNENSTGNYLDNTKDCHNCFFSQNIQDLENSIQIRDAKDSMDFLGFGMHAELIYRSHGCGDNAYNLKFCLSCFGNVRDLEYCIYANSGTKDCFGCISLKRQEYCILNKKYSKEEYFALVERLKEHMRRSPLRSPDATFEGQAGEYGSFFPPHLSYFYYNQSEGMNYFPITKEEATKRGFAWFTEKVEDFVPTYTLPDHIRDVKDDVLHAVLRSEKSGKKYRMIKQELEFYRRMNVPPPHTSPMERIQENLKHTAILPLKTMKCSRHGETIETVYDSTKQQVYCEKCYQETIL